MVLAKKVRAASAVVQVKLPVVKASAKLTAMPEPLETVILPQLLPALVML